MTDETTPTQPVEEKRKPGPKPGAKAARPRADGPNAELAARRAARLERGGVDYTNEQRLTVAGANLDFNNWSYRWCNEEIGNIEALKAQEWEDVSDDEMNGLPKARFVGLSKEGKAMNGRLMKKWKPWFDEDQAAKNREFREREKALKSGKIKPREESSDDAGKSYALPTNQVAVATPTKSAGGYSP